MEYTIGAFFTEKADDDVDGFVVIECDEQGGYYRLAEKAQPFNDDRDKVWHDYWVSEAALKSRVEQGDCVFAKNVTDKQLRGVMKLAGVTDPRTEEATPSA